MIFLIIEWYNPEETKNVCLRVRPCPRYCSISILNSLKYGVTASWMLILSCYSWFSLVFYSKFSSSTVKVDKVQRYNIEPKDNPRVQVINSDLTVMWNHDTTHCCTLMDNIFFYTSYFIFSLNYQVLLQVLQFYKSFASAVSLSRAFVSPPFAIKSTFLWGSYQCAIPLIYLDKTFLP